MHEREELETRWGRHQGRGRARWGKQRQLHEGHNKRRGWSMQGSRHTSTAEGGEQIQKTQGAQGSDGEETGRGRGGLEARHRRDTTGRAGAARTGDVTGRVGGKSGQKARGQRGQRGRWGPWQWQSQRGGEGRGSWGRTGRCRQPSMVGEGHGAEGRKAGAGATANGRAGTQHAGATECYQQACEGQWCPQPAQQLPKKPGVRSGEGAIRCQSALPLLPRPWPNPSLFTARARETLSRTVPCRALRSRQQGRGAAAIDYRVHTCRQLMQGWCKPGWLEPVRTWCEAGARIDAVCAHMHEAPHIFHCISQHWRAALLTTCPQTNHQGCGCMFHTVGPGK